MLFEPTSIGVGPAALDAEALARLRELDPSGTIHLVVKVVRAFEGNLQRHVPQMRAALVEGDRPKLLYHAHTLKSGSANLGATALWERCVAVERQATEGAIETLSTLVAEIEALAGPAVLALRALPEMAAS